MFGIALASLQVRHFRFTILPDFLSDRMQARLFSAVDLVTVAVGVALAWSGVVFVMRRPEIEASGLIGTAKDIAASTGLEMFVWLGRMGTYQSAIAFGGAILSLAAIIRFFSRLKES